MIGIVLAGGQATRIGGGDKGALLVGGTTILERVVTRLRAQCDHVIINANGDSQRFAALQLPVVADTVVGQPGPLAGVLAALDHVASHHPDAPFAVTVPADTPFLPVDLVARLQDQRVADRAEIVCARSGDATHHVVALWSVTLRSNLRAALVDEDMRKVRSFMDRHAAAFVTWPTDPCDPFFNVNTRADLDQAERIAAAL